MVSYKKLYEKQIKRNENLQNQVSNLKNEIGKLQSTYRINAVDMEIKKLKLLTEQHHLGFNKGDFVYITYKKGQTPFINLGFIAKETIYHIKLLVYDKKRNAAHKYIINKELIGNIKHYDGEDQSIISYNDLLELWQKEKSIKASCKHKV